MSKLLGKAAPDVSCTLVSNPSTKTSLLKQISKGKPLVVCFVSKSLSPVETNAAVQRLEETSFQVKDKCVFVVISLDKNIAEAKNLSKEGAIRSCVHLYSPNQGKEYQVNRTPAHFVIGANGKVLLASEDEVVDYRSLIT